MFCQACGNQILYGDGMARYEVHRACIEGTAGTPVMLKPTTSWKEYAVDGYSFSLKSDGQGGLSIMREPLW